MVDLPPTPPSNCGLGISLPMSIEEFRAARAGGSHADYVGRSGDEPADEVWRDVFQPVANAAGRLAGEARRAGVNVVERACLSDLRSLFASCRVVTLVAHWRGPEIDVCDLLLEPEELADIIEIEPSHEGQLLRAGLPADWRTAMSTAGNRRQRGSKLAETLDRRLSGGPPMITAPAGFGWHIDASTLRHLNREVLDALLPQALRPGNRLELSDGLHEVAAVIDCADTNWSGIVDLSCCQSAQLIDGIKQGRDDRIVIANDNETNPVSRLAILSILYEMVASAPRNYAAVRVALASHDLQSQFAKPI